MDSTSALLRFLLKSEVLSELPSDSEMQTISQFPIWGLSQKGYFEEIEAIIAIADGLSIDYLNLDDPETEELFTIDQYVNSLEAGYCWSRRVLPLYEKNGSIVTAVANPFDQEARKVLEFSLSRTVDIVIAEESKILRLLSIHYPNAQFEVDPDHFDSDDEEVQTFTKTELQEIVDLSQRDTPPIIRLVNRILADAYKFGASDVHLEPGERIMDVRFRVDGKLHDVIKIPRKIQANVVARIKILAEMDISEQRRPQDGRVRASIASQTVDLRVSTVPTAYGEKVVLRLLCADYSSMKFDDLGFPAQVQSRWESCIARTGKLLLVTGPTGSGKTTTLYTSLCYINDGTHNITTIEDPVEYQFQGINQIQVNRAADVTFASVLRSVLRQDPDTIMVGEIRDPETLSISLAAAQTGHLVLSSLHTNNAPAVISRLIDLGADPRYLASSLLGVMAQRLARRVCEKCSDSLSEPEIESFSRYIDNYEIWPEMLRVGRGCPKCFYSGYRGRIGIYSFLEITKPVAEAIFNKASQEEIISLAKESGFRELDVAAIDLVQKGATSLAEVVPYLNDEKKVVSEITQTPSPKSTDSQALLSKTSPTEKHSHPKVLVVDDSESARKFLTALLKQENMEVEEAASSIEALQKISSSPPSVIISDLKMPSMNGQEFLMKIKADPLSCNIPIAVLTARDSRQMEEEALQLGADDFISKRSSPQIITRRICKLVARTQGRGGS